MKKIKIWVPKGSKAGSYVLPDASQPLDREIIDAFEEEEDTPECVCDIPDLMTKGCLCGAFEKEQEDKL